MENLTWDTMYATIGNYERIRIYPYATFEKFIHRKKIDCTGMPGRLAPELDRDQNFGVDISF